MKIRNIDYFSILIPAIFLACVFEEQNTDFDYTEKYAEPFIASAPSIEIDGNNEAHILANAAMLYTKRNSDTLNLDIFRRNTVTYHYTLSNSSVQSHNFKNMFNYGNNNFLFGQTRYSDKLCAAVKDLNKFIIYTFKMTEKTAFLIVEGIMIVINYSRNSS